MKKLLFICLLGCLCMPRLDAQYALPKKWLLKVDPASGAFHEFRIVYERRLFKDWWVVGLPSFLYQNAMGKRQKLFGGIIRAGIRRYFFTDFSPKGFYIHAGAAYRLRAVTFFDDNLDKIGRVYINSPGVTAVAGYQWLFSPKKNIAIGFNGGVEFFYNAYGKGYGPNDIINNYYELPFLDEFRAYLGLEIGFAFRQKHLHW